jgi:hypothetical protein
MNEGEGGWLVWLLWLWLITHCLGQGGVRIEGLVC